jgi:FtsP/CotA-like multicopper oxidase with cupredoxin domain
MRIQERKQKFHPTIPPTTVWGFDGVFPGPTFKARYGRPNLVRFYNELPSNHVGFGIPSTTIHLHNGHTASESDGNPSNFFDSGTCWDNHYPNVLAGFSSDPAGVGDPNEVMNTLWYHDHRQDFTAQNVYSGLEGFYLLFDDLDCDDETNASGYRLPSGNYDIPLMFNDKVFGQDGNLVYDFFSLDGILGDKMCVNGKVQPYLNVERRKYRFRLLNGGPSRVYAFGISDNSAISQISSDGNLLPRPVVRGIPGAVPDLNDYIVMGVAERMDVIIDFSRYGPNTRVYLVNWADQINGAGPTGRIAKTSTPIIQFRVGNLPTTPDPSVVPTTMRTLPTVDRAGVDDQRPGVRRERSTRRGAARDQRDLDAARRQRLVASRPHPLRGAPDPLAQRRRLAAGLRRTQGRGAAAWRRDGGGVLPLPRLAREIPDALSQRCSRGSRDDDPLGHGGPERGGVDLGHATGRAAGPRARDQESAS